MHKSGELIFGKNLKLFIQILWTKFQLNFKSELLTDVNYYYLIY